MDAQKEKIKGFMKARLGPDCTLYTFADEGITSKVPFHLRPAGAKIEAGIRKGMIHVVVLTKLDRAFRSVVEMQRTVDRWVKAGVEVRIINALDGAPISNKDPQTKVYLTMLAMFAEYERDMAGQRTRDGLAYIKDTLSRKEKYISRKSKEEVKQLGRTIEELEEARAMSSKNARDAAMARAALLAPAFKAAIEVVKKRKPAPYVGGTLSFEAVAHQFRQDPKLTIPMTKAMPTKHAFVNDDGVLCVSARDASASMIRNIFRTCLDHGFIDAEDMLE